MSTRYPFAVIKEQLFARKGRVADFAIGSLPIALPEPVAEWIAEHAALATRPATPDDLAAFRDAATAFLAAEYEIDPASVAILPAPGGRVAMSAFVASMLEPGDAVLVTEPGYPVAARLAAQRGAVVHGVALRFEREFAPDLGSLDAATIQSVKAVFVNYPNNPTGAALTSGIRASLDALADSGAALLNDAVYAPLCYESRPSSLLTDAGGGLRPDVLELHAMTKLYPLGPMSVSFLAGAEDLIAPIATHAEYAWSAMSALELGATGWCLRDGAGISERRAFLADQVARLRACLTEVGFEPFPTPAGLYVLCPAPSEIAGRAVDSAAAAALTLMDEFDVAVMPFDVGRDRYLRFSALYRPEDLERLAALAGSLGLHADR